MVGGRCLGEGSVRDGARCVSVGGGGGKGHRPGSRKK
jgi:hypothetical protein